MKIPTAYLDNISLKALIYHQCSQAKINAVFRQLNGRPRKILEFRTPVQKLMHMLR